MRGFLRAGVVDVCLILVFSQGAVAFNVSKITIYPSGSLTPGTPVVVDGKIDFVPSSNVTFDSANELQFSTELEKPKWTWTLILDGVENPRPQAGGNSLSLSGFDLSYPNTVHESVRFNLEGWVPPVEQNQNKTLIRIQEIDEKDIPTGSTCEHSALVINVRESTCCIEPIYETLQKFKSHIEEKSAAGVNTTRAEENYNIAEQRIASAGSRPSSQIATTFAELNEARSAITEGERLLDKAWAEKTVEDAKTPIINFDREIQGLTGKKLSNSNLTELNRIVQKRILVMDFISAADEEIAAGNYSKARELAREAYVKGNESYAEIRTCSADISNSHNSLCTKPFAVTSLIILGICAAIIIVLIAGIVWWERKKNGETP